MAAFPRVGYPLGRHPGCGGAAVRRLQSMVGFILNILWFAVAVAMSGIILPRNRTRAGAGAAVACLIALFFPIVSISDDLSAVRDAYEEVNAAPCGLHAGHSARRLTGTTHPAVCPGPPAVVFSPSMVPAPAVATTPA